MRGNPRHYGVANRSFSSVFSGLRVKTAKQEASTAKQRPVFRARDGLLPRRNARWQENITRLGAQIALFQTKGSCAAPFCVVSTPVAEHAPQECELSARRVSIKSNRI
jgi:hypothetical protein